VAVQSGWAGVASRLAQTWSQNGQPSPESEQQHALEAAYVERRLRPVFRAALVGAAVLAEADAARRATADADRLGRAEEERRLTRGQRRLCGTWQWTVHNHQNHQDHKFPMVFPPPGEPVNGASGPVSVVVRGDTVFLRWTYPTGYQEDSLLFTGEGNRLEGSFINSGGAWGSITGKRVAPCKG
jgi:hypothetical protein